MTKTDGFEEQLTLLQTEGLKIGKGPKGPQRRCFTRTL